MAIDDSIVNGFKKLLLIHYYEKITIDMICKEASVSRKTFYNHFNGKEAIFRKIIHDDVRIPLENIRSLLPTRQIKSAPLLLAEKTYEEFYDQKALFLRLRSKADILLLRETVFSELLAMNKEIMANYPVDEIELDYLTYFCASTNTSLISKWILDGMVLPPKQAARFFYKWVIKNLDRYNTDDLGSR
jgi:AcrR family transcriptional regulator